MNNRKSYEDFRDALRARVALQLAEALQWSELSKESLIALFGISGMTRISQVLGANVAVNMDHLAKVAYEVGFEVDVVLRPITEAVKRECAAQEKADMRALEEAALKGPRNNEVASESIPSSERPTKTMHAASPPDESHWSPYHSK